MQLRFAARSTDAGGGCHSLGKQLSTNLYHLHDWQSSPKDADQVATEHTVFSSHSAASWIERGGECCGFSLAHWRGVTSLENSSAAV